MKRDVDNNINQLYENIKATVVKHQHRSGERINIELLAEQARVSTTPVREVLNRLVAEGLLVLRPQLGFFVRDITEADLRDIYDANEVLLNWCAAKLKQLSREIEHLKFPQPNIDGLQLQGAAELSPGQIAKITGAIFFHLAKLSRNEEIKARIVNFNDRLYHVRTLECGLVSNPLDSLQRIYEAFAEKEFEYIQSCLHTYHADRLRIVSTVIRSLHTLD